MVKLSYFCRLMSAFIIGHLGFWIQHSTSLNDPNRSLNSIQKALTLIKVEKLMPAFEPFQSNSIILHTVIQFRLPTKRTQTERLEVVWVRERTRLYLSREEHSQPLLLY